MPLYEYRCRDCDHQLEVLQKLSDRPLRRCDKCQGKLEKLISRTSFQLKGGGWFDQGYGKGGSKKGSKKASTTKPDSKSGKSGSGESSGDSSSTPKSKTAASG